MTQKEFFYLYFGLAIMFILLYMFNRKATRSPSKLKMTGQRTSNEMVIHDAEAKAIALPFDHNGKVWDAYDVLGITPGAKLKEIRKAYEKKYNTSPKELMPVLEAALRAVLRDLANPK